MMQSVKRFDYGQIGAVEMTPQGFLKVPGFATRTGVFTYRDKSGNVRRELRHPDDVFDPVSLATLKYAPVTLDHPPVMLTPENIQKYTKGHATERVEVNRDLVETDLIIEAKDAIDAVQNGMRELSCGYLADIVDESGVYNGAEYDCRQKNIKNNHIAIVDKGRAGPEVRLRMDAEDAVLDEQVATPRAEFTQESDKMDKESEGEMKEIVISGETVKLPPRIADIVQAMMDRYDQLKGQIMKLEETMPTNEEKKDVDVSQKNVSAQVKVEQKAPDGRGSAGKAGAGDKGGAAQAKGDEDEKDEKKKDGEEDEKKEKKDYDGAGGDGVAKSPVEQLKDAMESMKAQHAQQLDSMQAKLDEFASQSIAGGEKKMDSADRKAIRARVRLERTAEKFLPTETVAKFDAMTDEEIRAAVIKRRHPNADLTGKSAVYLESRFDSLVESIEGSESVRREMGAHLLGNGKNRMDNETEVNPAEKRRAMIEDSRKLHLQPLSASKK